MPEDLWLAVQARLARASELIPRAHGKLLGRPSYLDGQESAYLLTGFATCGICGGAVGSIPRAHGSKGARRRVEYYGCFTNHRRGGAICANGAHIRQDLLDHALLEALSKVLDERLIDQAVETALADLRAGHAQQFSRRQQIERELSLVQNRIQRCLDVILDATGDIGAAKQRFRDESARKEALATELERMQALERVTTLDSERVKRDLRMRAADVKGLLSRHTAQARQMLRKILVGPIELTPFTTEGCRGYRFSGMGTYERLLAGTTLPRTVVAPTGFEPVFQP